MNCPLCYSVSSFLAKTELLYPSHGTRHIAIPGLQRTVKRARLGGSRVTDKSKVCRTPFCIEMCGLKMFRPQNVRHCRKKIHPRNASYTNRTMWMWVHEKIRSLLLRCLRLFSFHALSKRSRVEAIGEVSRGGLLSMNILSTRFDSNRYQYRRLTYTGIYMYI